jgi:hypothetical protein
MLLLLLLLFVSTYAQEPCQLSVLSTQVGGDFGTKTTYRCECSGVDYNPLVESVKWTISLPPFLDQSTKHLTMDMMFRPMQIAKLFEWRQWLLLQFFHDESRKAVYETASLYGISNPFGDEDNKITNLTVETFGEHLDHDILVKSVSNYVESAPDALREHMFDFRLFPKKLYFRFIFTVLEPVC